MLEIIDMSRVFHAGYKITPKPCKVPGSEVKEGTCMFVWECIKSEGTHVGVCVDTFMFGSCCVHNTTVNTISPSQQHPHHHTRPHHHHQQQHQHDNLSTTLRPSLLSAEPVGNESTRLTSTFLTSSSSWTASSTARPSLHHFSESHSPPIGGSTRPMKPFANGLARPLQKRPHAKPTSEHDVDRSQTPAIPSASPSSWGEGRPQNTKRPGHHGSHPHQKIRPAASASEKPSSGPSQPGFKDKLDTAHNTLVVRLPGKEHASAEDEVAGSTSGKPNKPNKPSKPSKPSNQRPFELRPDDGKTEDAADLSVQETIHRPNVNTVMESVSMKFGFFHRDV